MSIFLIVVFGFDVSQSFRKKFIEAKILIFLELDIAAICYKKIRTSYIFLVTAGQINREKTLGL